MFKLRGLLLTLLCLSSSIGLAQEYYRYKNTEGQTVMDTTVPAEYVNSGYDVLNSRGQFIESVPPVQEVNSLEASQANQIADRALSDQVLLSSYSTVEEIDAHRLRKLLAIEREMSNVETDQRVVQIEIDKTAAEVANYASEEVPLDLSNLLTDLKNTMVKLADQLERRQLDLIEIEEEFVGKIDRFRQLRAEIQQR